MKPSIKAEACNQEERPQDHLWTLALKAPEINEKGIYSTLPMVLRDWPSWTITGLEVKELELKLLRGNFGRLESL